MERKRSPLSKVFDLIGAVENIALVIFVVGMLITILIQIGGRISGHPAPWTEETSRYLFLWMMFVALASGFNMAESSRVTLLLQIGPKWLKIFSEMLYAVVVLAFFVFMVIWGSEIVRQQIRFNERGTAVMIQMWIIGICQPIAGVLGIIGVIQSFLEYRFKVAIGDKDTEKKKALEQG